MPRYRTTQILNRVCVFLSIGVMLPAFAPAQQLASATPCNCADLASLQHRLEEVTALKPQLQERLQAANSADLASRLLWQNLETELRNQLQTLQSQHLATPANMAMLNNAVDPSCGPPGQSFGACLDRDWAAHQQVHEQSCQAGRWSGQNLWTMREALQEEIKAVDAEMDFLQAEVARLSCQCPHFMIMVQVVTTTAVSSSPLTERSGRSLNGMGGIPVPIVLHDDGTFEGFGSGSDSGTANARAGPLNANSQFGHQLVIRATGQIHPGSCTTKPCTPDMMHLVLDGVASPQAVQGRVTGPGINRSINNKTPGGSGVEVFDLPAYVGSSAQKSLLANSIVNSLMTVWIVPAALSQPGSLQSSSGASLLYSLMECRLATVLSPGGPPGGPSGGGGTKAGAGEGGAGAGRSGGSLGSVGQSQSAAVIDIKENVHTTDSSPITPGQPHAVVVVNETIQTSEALEPTAVINVAERIHTTDSPLWPAVVRVNENVQVGDAVRPDVTLSVVESIHVTDSATSGR